ncbi:MAG: phosphotransferase, partial [Wenzhouxiangellaceae bacterium]
MLCKSTGLGTIASMSENLDQRARQALEWAARCLGWTDPEFAPASSDASFRRYFRISHGMDSRIVMDAPPDAEPLEPFVDVARRLAAAGLNVPEVLAQDHERGFLLLTDLGRRPWHRVLDEDNAAGMFADAISALTTMQAKADATGLPEYDAALLLRELALFPDWFLARHWRVEPTETEFDDWEMVCMTLIRWALDQSQVFVHRDFMPRNQLRKLQRVVRLGALPLPVQVEMPLDPGREDRQVWAELHPGAPGRETVVGLQRHLLRAKAGAAQAVVDLRNQHVLAPDQAPFLSGQPLAHRPFRGEQRRHTARVGRSGRCGWYRSAAQLATRSTQRERRVSRTVVGKIHAPGRGCLSHRQHPVRAQCPTERWLVDAQEPA